MAGYSHQWTGHAILIFEFLFLSEFVGFYNVLFENEHGDTAQQLRVPGPGEVSTQGPGGEDPMADPV